MFSIGFIFLLVLKMSSNTGVFRYDPAASGTPMYYFYLEDKVSCLRACYEENECAVVEYRENEEGYCRLYREGDTHSVKGGYTLSRGETNSSCKLIETLDFDVSFQEITGQENSSEAECSVMPDVAVLQPYDKVKYRFFVPDSTKVAENWVASEFRLLFSKKAEVSCTSVPVFHKANHRRLYFGEIYNTTGYTFYNAYAFTNLCVSPTGECLGVQEIKEYVDEQGNFFYDAPGRMDMADSGLGQIFFISGKSY
ncbi:unnamed protein product [Cylicocyclus nassatus]|uniref:PAN-3 domain-containing protein n=1 Tax=Cylicocyclus nassatus TaxID=53992 RepID=A0AA36DSU4_CYLNA|nr:unnamed protein product [Cylicocyclus nassatus]